MDFRQISREVREIRSITTVYSRRLAARRASSIQRLVILIESEGGWYLLHLKMRLSKCLLKYSTCCTDLQFVPKSGMTTSSGLRQWRIKLCDLRRNQVDQKLSPSPLRLLPSVQVSYFRPTAAPRDDPYPSLAQQRVKRVTHSTWGLSA